MIEFNPNDKETTHLVHPDAIQQWEDGRLVRMRPSQDLRLHQLMDRMGCYGPQGLDTFLDIIEREIQSKIAFESTPSETWYGNDAPQSWP